jgi:hypothetical protein
MAAHVIPVHRCAELTGARPSPGFVHGLLARAAAVQHADQLIRALIITASVICADETTRSAWAPRTAFKGVVTVPKLTAVLRPLSVVPPAAEGDGETGR